jgi:hypothetical protein
MRLAKSTVRVVYLAFAFPAVLALLLFTATLSDLGFTNSHRPWTTAA